MTQIIAHRRWKRVPISEVYLSFYDGPHATPRPSSEGPIFLGIGNITEDGHLNLSNVRHIAEEDMPKWTKRVVPSPGDIVFTYEGTLNRYAIIPIGFRGCLGRRVALIRSDPAKIDYRYLLYYFFSDDWRRTISTNTILGATVERIPLIRFPQFEIELPPLIEQKKIATVLSNYDNLIDNNTRRIQLLEQIARLIYDEWFVKLKFPGHENVKMIDSEIGDIPEGWEIKKLGDVIEFKKGKQAKNILEKPNLGSLPYLLIDGIKTGSYVYTDEKGVYASKRDLLMVMDGASSGMVYSGQEGYVGSTLALIDINDKSVFPEYLMLFLISNFNQISSNNTGAAIPHANKEFMYQMDIVLPKKEIRELLFLFFKNLFTMKTTLELKNINLRKTRDLLLPKLISGALDVSHLDIKTPEEKK